MNNPEDLLQELVAQLEAGVPVADTVDGLPTEEAAVVQLIASMRTLPFPDFDEATAVNQEALIMQAATRQFPPATATTTLPARHLLQRAQSWLDALLTRRELAWGLAAIFLLVMTAVAWLGLSAQRAGNNAPTTQTLTKDAAAEVAAAPSPSVAANDGVNDAESVVGAAAAANEAASGTTASGLLSGQGAYLPLISIPLNLNPQTAKLDDFQGHIQIQTEPDTWETVNRATTLRAGQRIRTGALSQATLTFFDGSQAHLSAGSELAIDELDAQEPGSGFRTVRLTQWLGASEHEVAFRNDAGSTYEVNSPSGKGIARGTKFQVSVTPNLLARYIVTEGKVDVTALSRTVSVVAGQLTSVMAGRAPELPSFIISGEGEVSQTGQSWIIGGQTFGTHDMTVVIGNPQLGDLVHVQGHLATDGSRLADRITLIRESITNRFTLSGEVTSVDPALWTVAGQSISIGTETIIGAGVELGSLVRVDGLILAGGGLMAETIVVIDDAPGYPFQFTGIVQDTDNDMWLISGTRIEIDSATVIEAGLETGHVVDVQGRILEDGTWLASEISRHSTDLPSFAFTGVVQGTDPWVVAGIPFSTRPWTLIDPGIQIGDIVHVQGSITEDGLWVASAVTLLQETTSVIIFAGVVSSIDPWIVNGLQLFVTDDTLILGDIGVGTLVMVEAQLLPDGTWRVLTIRALYPDFGYGCLIITTAVNGISGNQILLDHWNNITLNDTIVVEGDLQPNSIISFPICTLTNGTVIIIGNIIVIYQPIIIIVPPAAPPANNNGHGNRNGPRNKNG